MNVTKAGVAAGALLVVGAMWAPVHAAGVDCGLNTGKAATGEPIPIGAIVTASGVADISSGAKGAKAYFDCVNASGGIHGRPIAYTIEDDQTRPDRAAEIARKLIEDKKAVALVGSSSLVDCIATSQYYQQSGIISLMAAGVAPQCFNARNIATLNAGPRYGLIGAAKYAVEHLGAKHIVCPQPSVPGADWSCSGVGAYAKKAGVKFSTFVYDQASADNDALIQQILETGGDSVVYNGSPPTFVAFLAAAERNDVGDKLKMLTPSPMYNAGMPKAVGPYWNDRLWVDIEFGPLDANGPDTQNYRAVMKAFNTEFDSLGEGGYLAARMVTKALLSLDPDKVDRASITKAIQNIQNYKSDLLCSDWSFGPKDADARLGNRSGWIAQISNGEWKVNPGCVSTDEALISK